MRLVTRLFQQTPVFQGLSEEEEEERRKRG